MGIDSLSSSSASAMHRIQSNVVKAFTGYYRLKDFIHALRACKTQAAERALVAKEGFAIRNGFKEECSQDHRYHSIAKLLYIHLLGYPTHYGQIECLKLAASPRLKDKRLGYFGVVLLLDEHQQTLTLVTNSLKSDLNSTNPTVIGLALSALASVGSEEIVYELADEVLRHLSSTNPYVRKKAAFCACRLVVKVPDLEEQFESKLTGLIGDRNHAVVLGGLALAQTLIEASPSLLITFRRSLVPSIVKLLTTLMSSSSLEYDVSGVNDPFLQIKALRLLRTLGKGDAEASDLMSDILTQMASSLESPRNSTQSVLYEVLQTILSIKSDQSLKAMAINCLGKMLQSNEDNINTRYVSLTLMVKLVDSGAGIETVQRHRQTVLDCLHDSDVTIRRRAAEVSLALINKTTIKSIFTELTCADLLQEDSSVISRLAILAAKHAPSARWYVDSMILLFSSKACSKDIKCETIITSFLRIISNTPEIQAYATSTLFTACTESPNEALVQATAWCTGEYGHLLMIESTDPLDRLSAPIMLKTFSITELISSLASWSSKFSLSTTTLSYIITALGKLSVRFEPQMEVLTRTIKGIAISNPEVRDKATETLAFMQSIALRSLVFAAIPADSGAKIGSSSPSLPNAVSSIGEVNSGSASPAPIVDVFAELASLSLTGLNSNQQSPLAGSPKQPFTESANGKLIYQGNGLQIGLSFNPDDSSVLLIAKNAGKANVKDFQILAAVPKSLRVSLRPASGTSLPAAGGQVTQLLQVTSANPDAEPSVDSSKIKLRLRISFKLPNDQTVTETCEVSSVI